MTESSPAAISVPLKPHALQVGILKALFDEPGVRVVVVGTGRQVGKTETCKMAMVEAIARAPGYCKVDYGAPTYIRAGEVYQEMCANLKPIILRKRDAAFTIEIRPVGRNREGGRITFRSLESHDNIRGDNSDLWIVDEMCDVVEQAWKATILPMLMARKGKALLLGTPKRVGKGFLWARQEWLKARDPDNRTHRSFSAPSSANPGLAKDDLDLMSSNMTEDVYKEEILGEWLDNEGAVFKKLDRAFVLPFVADSAICWRGALPMPGRKYLIAYDIGAHNDYNIITVFDLSTKEQVELWRSRGEDHDLVLERLHRVRERWHGATIYADGNGIGQPIVARLAKKYGDGVVDRKWSSNAMKLNDVMAAQLLFEQEEWKFLAVPWQMAEFQAYTMERMPSGGFRYQAPEGGHDDAVAAACMLAERVKLEWRPQVKREPFLPTGRDADGNMTVPVDFIPQMERAERNRKWKWPWTR